MSLNFENNSWSLMDFGCMAVYLAFFSTGDVLRSVIIQIQNVLAHVRRVQLTLNVVMLHEDSGGAHP